MTTEERRLRRRLRDELSEHPLPAANELVLAALPSQRAPQRTGAIVHTGWLIFLVALVVMAGGFVTGRPAALPAAASLTLLALVLGKIGAGLAAQPIGSRVTARQLLLSGLVEAD